MTYFQGPWELKFCFGEFDALFSYTSAVPLKRADGKCCSLPVLFLNRKLSVMGSYSVGRLLVRRPWKDLFGIPVLEPDICLVAHLKAVSWENFWWELSILGVFLNCLWMMVTLSCLAQLIFLLSPRVADAIQVQMTEPEIGMVTSESTFCYLICIGKWWMVAYPTLVDRP